MIMKTMTKYLASLALLTAACAIGCGSSSGSNDAGVGGSTGTAGGSRDGRRTRGDPCGGHHALRDLDGDTCFDVVSVAAGSSDRLHCSASRRRRHGRVGTALPVHYDMPTGHRDGRHDGLARRGAGALQHGHAHPREHPMLDTMATCTWHQADTSMVTVTAMNELQHLGDRGAEHVRPGLLPGQRPGPAAFAHPPGTWHMKEERREDGRPPAN